MEKASQRQAKYYAVHLQNEPPTESSCRNQNEPVIHSCVQNQASSVSYLYLLFLNMK